MAKVDQFKEETYQRKSNFPSKLLLVVYEVDSVALLQVMLG